MRNLQLQGPQEALGGLQENGTPKTGRLALVRLRLFLRRLCFPRDPEVLVASTAAAFFSGRHRATLKFAERAEDALMRGGLAVSEGHRLRCQVAIAAGLACHQLHHQAGYGQPSCSREALNWFRVLAECDADALQQAIVTMPLPKESEIHLASLILRKGILSKVVP